MSRLSADSWSFCAFAEDRYAFALGYRQAVKKWGDRTPPPRVLNELREDYVALVQLQGKHFEFREPPPAWFAEIRRAADAKPNP